MTKEDRLVIRHAIDLVNNYKAFRDAVARSEALQDSDVVTRVYQMMPLGFNEYQYGPSEATMDDWLEDLRRIEDEVGDEA